jgi:hypothetical protein
MSAVGILIAVSLEIVAAQLEIQAGMAPKRTSHPRLTEEKRGLGDRRVGTEVTISRADVFRRFRGRCLLSEVIRAARRRPLKHQREREHERIRGF